MYKLLIVDDEYWVRKGLSETINWAELDVEVAGLAADGEEALSIIEREKPDIVITDMRMPGMDGIALTNAISERGCDCAVIVLSGYKDFDYVKATLENGVHAYLLKPVENEQLIKAVLTEIGKLETARENARYLTHLEEELPAIHHKLVYDLLLGNFNDEGTLLEKMRICKLKVPPCGTLVYATAEDGEAAANERFRSYLRAHFPRGERPVVEFYDTFAVMLLDTQDIEAVAARCRAFEETFEKECKDIVSIAVCGPYMGLREVSGCYHTAKHRVKNRLFRVVNTVLTNDSSAGNYHQVVIDAVAYICKHYAENITIKSCASELYVSDSHLMHLFKEDLGKTFNDYLTEYRISQAKKLLREGKLHVYEIAYAVGYSDIKYFGQVFRRYVGCMPSEYVGGVDAK